MLDFYKPDWLYESLPCLYIAAGGAAIVFMEHGLGRASGALLILAGVWIFIVRRISRASLVRPDKFRRLNRLR